MRSAGKDRPTRLSWFLAQAQGFFADHPIDQVRYEEPMKVAIANKIGVNDETITILRGTVALLEVAAVRAGIADIGTFTVLEARKHLVGTSIPQGEGKRQVMRVCQMLKVPVTNDNEGDAYAGWSYCCGLANPRIAHLVTPLFSGT
jgi:hypothetical protein